MNILLWKCGDISSEVKTKSGVWVNKWEVKCIKLNRLKRYIDSRITYMIGIEDFVFSSSWYIHLYNNIT